ncbi:SDR family oxidoreductase [Truepera radiovictrix]|uniref:Short-chain dehydrogenase/reductase SDR n=1 Tax=Truepera radiovictrix (strain DSM 17093 / CIP 108686 / LMG 22925 / RQ-24) TaxID=649638 RepID=D7CVA3_TRURR|nr:SDR family oxidoreductase [Truepera radiovictrix]ADI14131.1 short-chain dehydrogenase/reductase SDR [Truepera radiovictrix DSM 17093]WMT57308.1 SDR family oxidoreductase [Truepera radiovictrix]
MASASPLAGKRAVVTGASSGIGRAVALELARQGVTLHLLGRREGALAEVVRQVQGWGGAARAYPVDLTDERALREVGAELGEGGLDVLVHSAGTVSLGPVLEASVADFDRQYALNVRAPFLLTQLLLPSLKRARGQVAFLNSGSGLVARASWSQYAATKHALKALADALREEVKADGVRVVSVYPGRTASPMQARVHELEGRAYDPARFVQPESVAAMILAALALPPTAEVTDLSVRPGPG